MIRWIAAALTAAATAPFLSSLFSWWAANEPALVAFSLMMPVIAAVGCWLRVRLSKPSRSAESRGLALALAALSIVLATVGWGLQDMLPGALGLWLGLAALAGLLGPAPWTARFAVPLAPLALTPPLTAGLAESIEATLQLASASLGAFWLGVVGVEVERNGLLLETPTFHNMVNETCSGINTLSSLAVYTILLGVMLSLRDRFIIAAAVAALPVALLLNGARIAWVSVLGERGGTALAMGPWHDISGYVSFLVGYVVLLLGMLLTHRKSTSPRIEQPDEQQGRAQPGQ